MVLSANATANFLGAVMGNHVTISEQIPPDPSAPTTVQFQCEPVTGSISLVQNGRRTAEQLRPNEVVLNLETAMDNVARAGGGYLTLMHADGVVSQQSISSAHMTVGCLCITMGILLVLLILFNFIR